MALRSLIGTTTSQATSPVSNRRLCGRMPMALTTSEINPVSVKSSIWRNAVASIASMVACPPHCVDVPLAGMFVVVINIEQDLEVDELRWYANATIFGVGDTSGIKQVLPEIYPTRPDSFTLSRCMRGSWFVFEIAHNGIKVFRVTVRKLNGLCCGALDPSCRCSCNHIFA